MAASSQPRYRKYSIIVPSYNRADELADLLNSINALDFDPERFELIIADDGSTDASVDLVETFRRNSSFNLFCYGQTNQGPGAARNFGMQKATGDFFIFIDSDVTVPPGWLKSIDAELNATGADAYGGPDTFRDSFPPLLKAINYSMTSFITTGGLRGRKGKKLARFYPRSFNMGLSRKLWQEIGGFGNLRHGQDIEFSNRIIRSGAKVAYIHDAAVYHKRRTSIRRFYKQVFNWGMARVNLFKMDPAMFEPLHAAPAVATLIAITVLLLAPFSSFFMLILIGGLILAAIVLLFSMIDAVRLYRQLTPAFYLPLVMPAQIFGYGLGFLVNFVRRVLFRKEAKVGFKKNYYK